MIEQIMFFGIGFLVASLLGLVIIPFVHNRAARLAVRRIEAATPLTMAEIQADKDQLRAEFAMSTRRLEMNVEQLKGRSTSQLSELSKKTEAIHRLKAELGEKTATIFALEARDKSLRDQLRATEQEYSVKTTDMYETERTLNDKAAELAKLSAKLGERAEVTDTQRVEIAALRTQVESFKAQLIQNEREVRETEQRLRRERSDADAATKALADERGKVENLGARVGELERQLIAQTTGAEILGRRAQELEQRLADQGRLLVQREYEATQLRGELEALRKTESDLRAELAGSDARHAANTEGLRADKARLEKEVERLRDEHSEFQHKIAVMKRDAESSWASERVESALLRERINDIAVEVARLTMTLEGPDSPIEAIIASEAAHEVVNGRMARDDRSGGNLADRIRALQSKASRAPSVS